MKLNKLLFNRGSQTEVEVFTPHEFLLDIEETRPKSARHFLPSWWKDMPKTNGSNDPLNLTAKSCPSFVQMFGQGIVLPMWSDTILYHDDWQQEYGYRSSNDLFKWEFHEDWQFIDHVKIPTFKKVYKAASPWYIRTKPNVSLLQLPMLFEFNQDWTIIPGVLNTDIVHQLNQQLVYTSNKQEFMISRGQAFVWYIPFVRTDFTYDTFLADDRLKQIVSNQSNAIFTKFNNHYIKEVKKVESKRKKHE
jgi:hypothetical protein